MASFNIGDHVAVKPLAKDSTTGEILAFRHEIGNRSTGALSYGCDVLLANGKTQFRYMHDVARDNPDRLHSLRLSDAAPELLAALKNLMAMVDSGIIRGDGKHDIETQARAAIARAEGPEG